MEIYKVKFAGIKTTKELNANKKSSFNITTRSYYFVFTEQLSNSSFKI